MSYPLMAIRISHEHDVVLARQRARQIAASLYFEAQDQVRIATAVSEIARNAFQYANGGLVEFLAAESPRKLQIRVSDTGPGIAALQEVLDGSYASTTGLGLGIVGTRRLMDEFQAESRTGAGTRIVMAKHLSARAPALTPALVAEVTDNLAQHTPPSPLGELQSQNQELLGTLAELEKRQAELTALNKELEYTNRGVVALYAELDEKADYLRRVSELKTQFLSNMTHEFRTPLNSILSISRILLDRLDGDLTSEQEKQVCFIQRAASDLSEIVNDLLDLAKVQAGKVTVRAAEFDMADLFGALRGMLRPLLAHNSSVALHFDDTRRIPMLHTDESKVSQILRNLIANALKFTDQGVVRVRADLEPGGLVSVAVSDTGIGISLADQDRIFEEFSQVEGVHQVGKRGTGLGLPLSRRLAELLGGTLAVSSAPGRGSIFTLRLPLHYSGPTEVSVVPEIPTVLDPTRFPVLVVEDNRETLLIYEKYLKGTPYQVVAARTLQQARSVLERCRPAAVILDVLLSHENTWLFLTDIKTQVQTSAIPVFVVTMVENEAKARALGADDFHSKPVNRQWLVGRLDQASQQLARPEVLVIDDDAAARYVLTGLLRETRFKVLECASGQEGLRLACQREPVAIFLDLNLPDASGFSLLNALSPPSASDGARVIIHTSKQLTNQETEELAQRKLMVLPKNHDDRIVSLQRIRDALAELPSCP